MDHVTKVGETASTITRTTISVPKRIKKMMDKVNGILAENDEKINWSAIASEAFEAYATTILEQRESKREKKRKDKS